MIDIKKIEEELVSYLEEFDHSKEKIALKHEHSLEVVKVMNMIVSKMNLTEEDKNLALTIAYLHDIGRFEQLVKIGKFDDFIYDHADNGVDLLFNRGLIKKFSIPEEYYRIINVAIKNHNKLSIEEGLTDQELFYSKLIRDADKIDIFRVRHKYNQDLFLETPNSENIKDFYDHKSIDLKNRVSKSDAILCVLAFVYDLNFKESFDVLKELDYLNMYISSIKVDDSVKEEFNGYIEEINKYMEDYNE
ncbi:MAG: HD domain-containing protein [Bacilli bacterium]|nr:HD domain-containing protein [Bacilli bacterium]